MRSECPRCAYVRWHWTQSFKSDNRLPDHLLRDMMERDIAEGHLTNHLTIGVQDYYDWLKNFASKSASP